MTVINGGQSSGKVVKYFDFNFKMETSSAVSKDLQPKHWQCDYPIIAYAKSFNQIAIINLLDSDKDKCQTVISIKPYVFECFVETEIKSNKKLYHKDREQESHIFILASRSGNLHLLDFRIDALRH